MTFGSARYPAIAAGDIVTRVDANLLVALALNDPRAPAVDRELGEAGTAGNTLHAPEQVLPLCSGHLP